MIKDATNLEPAYGVSLADDIRTGVTCTVRMIYYGLKESNELSDDDMRQIFIEAFGEDLGEALYEIGADEKSNAEVDMVFESIAEHPDAYHEFIDRVSE